jgi:[ribosomal protein S5]-alanine N-acetyltransferase
MKMNFNLREWQLSDADELVKHAGNFNVAKNMTDQFPHPYRLENAHAFIAIAQSAVPTRLFAIEVNGGAAGGIGLHPQSDIQRKNAELGYWLSEDYWGRGIMTKAVQQMVSYGFKTFDITRIYARPFGSNFGSQRVLEKAGFVLEGRFENALFKNGVFTDELIYAVRKGS